MRWIVSLKTLAVASAVLLVLGGRGAHAQTTSPDVLAKAKTLYDEAVALMEAKNFSAACPKLEAIIQLVPEGVGAKLTVAECYEGRGTLARAFEAYKLAEDAAIKAGQAEREKKAHERAAALEPKLSKLTIVMPESVQRLTDIEVLRDNMVVPPQSWNVPIPIDGGQHRITVTAKGKKPWQTTIEVPPSGAQTSVEVTRLEYATPVYHRVDEAPPEPERLPPADSGTAGSGRRTAGLIVAAAGVAGLIGGVSFGFLSKAKKDASNADGHCDKNNQCDQEGLDRRDSAIAMGNASTAFFIAGGALAVGGAVLFFTAPQPASPKVAPSVGLYVSPFHAGLRGEW